MHGNATGTWGSSGWLCRAGRASLAFFIFIFSPLLLLLILLLSALLPHAVRSIFGGGRFSHLLSIVGLASALCLFVLSLCLGWSWVLSSLVFVSIHSADSAFARLESGGMGKGEKARAGLTNVKRGGEPGHPLRGWGCFGVLCASLCIEFLSEDCRECICNLACSGWGYCEVLW